MKKFLLAATTVAALSAMSTSALAVVNLDTGVGLTTYASELITNGTTSLNGAVLDVTHVLGFGVSDTQTRYVRYDLTNGVFASSVVPADLGIPGAVTVAQGGGAGQNFVIFQ
jgi:opacity protein-like surface antigen